MASTHLQGLGYALLARNVRTRYGEIDLIALDERALVFVEVKTRRARAPAGAIPPEQEPLPWLRPRQRARVRRLAAAWLCEQPRKRPRVETIRFDAIGVIVDDRDRLLRLDHVQSAW